MIDKKRHHRKRRKRTDDRNSILAHSYKDRGYEVLAMDANPDTNLVSA
ncbi:MAG: hypothetical protein PVH84_10960 [Candidatus Aminicenantes bacterium]